MKLKWIFAFAVLILLSGKTFAGGNSYNEELKAYEDTMKALADTMVNSPQQFERQKACYQLIKTMVTALQIPGSYAYPFDSVKNISIMYAPDDKFRIFNWQLTMTSGVMRFYGAIQMNTKKNLEIYPLYDFSDYMKHPQDTITNNEKWYGCLYYRIMKLKNNYLLFGWDGNNLRSNRKLIDVLSFEDDGAPVFGAPIFTFGEGDAKKTCDRFILEYEEDAIVQLNWNDELEMIIYDHLQPKSEATKNLPYTYIPDGTYEGFKIEGGKLIYVPEVFTSTMSAPVYPKPLNFEK